MEITQRRQGDRLELAVTGRLDGTWADHLTGTLAEAIRQGMHHLVLDLAGVGYLSSAGIRVLIRTHKQMKELQGSLCIVNPSNQVRSVLALVGLEGLLISEQPSSSATRTETQPGPHVLEREHAVFEVHEVLPNASLQCCLIGDPAPLATAGFRPESCRTLSIPPQTMALGLGAFGADFDECSSRFGEFLAVAGAAAYLPTDGAQVPDFSMAQGAFVPSVHVLYALVCEGSFGTMLRFEATRESRAVPFSEVVEVCLDESGGDMVGLVIAAESAGLVGAALKRSPAAPPSGSESPFAFPGVRKWLSFTAEPTHVHGLAVVAGVAARRRDGGPMASMLRPLGRAGSLLGHFHAALFPYRPLQKGPLDLATTITTLFEGEQLQGLLHLLEDDRNLAGAGESAFVRGACWVAPIAASVGAEA